MKLSIIIVNYNVKYFLQQLLISIYKSKTDHAYEVIVVDNASSDGSREMVPAEFPQVRYIYNEENAGFSKANNQAIRDSQAEYVLLLNPDTLVEEDTIEKTVSFMDAHPDGGALGVRMIDGSGKYLPESKRGFPSPAVAFSKAFGLSYLFPRSSRFNGYYMGHLAPDQTNEVDVLTGAFMLLRRSVLQEVGLLDEQFFMYGEDIDLSYRIKQAGHKVFYYPQTSIVHFKGESTDKDSLKYIRRFYGAMKQFCVKHYASVGLPVVVLLNLAINIRALLSLAKRWVLRHGVVLLDLALVSLLLLLFSDLWARWYFGDPDYYQHSSIAINIGLYSAIGSLSLWMVGGYDRPFDGVRLARGWLIAWTVIAVSYAFFGPMLRSSRALVLASAPLAAAGLLLSRALLSLLQRGTWQFLQPDLRRYLIVGDQGETKRVLHLMQGNAERYRYQGVVSPSDQDYPGTLGSLPNLDQICRFHDVNEVIFCTKNVSAKAIMTWMTRLGDDLHIKIAPEQSASVVGSKSKNLPGELYTVEIHYRIADPAARRHKRLLDIGLATACLTLSPLLIWLVREKASFLRNILDVLRGSKTWVSYGSLDADDTFPSLRPGVLRVAMGRPEEPGSQHRRDADYHYARDYSVLKDLSLFITNIRRLGG